MQDHVGSDFNPIPSQSQQQLVTPLYSFDNTAYSFLLRLNGLNILLDCGISDNLDVVLIEPLIQYLNAGGTIDLILISSPSLCFGGALPLLCTILQQHSINPVVFIPMLTWRMLQVNLFDAFISVFNDGKVPPFSMIDINNVFNFVINVDIGERVPIPSSLNLLVTPRLCGRTVGSVSWEILLDESSLYIYAPSFNTAPETLLDPASFCGKELSEDHNEETQRDVQLFTTITPNPPSIFSREQNSQDPSSRNDEWAPLYTLFDGPGMKPLITNVESDDNPEAAFVDSVIDTLTNRGNVLIPVSPSGRVFQLILSLDRNRGPSSFTIAFIHPLAEYSSALLSYSTKYISTKLQEESRENSLPLGPNLRVLTSFEELHRYNPPYCIFCSFSSLFASSATTDYFLDFCSNQSNSIVFTEAAHLTELKKRVDEHFTVNTTKSDKLSVVYRGNKLVLLKGRAREDWDRQFRPEPQDEQETFGDSDDIQPNQKRKLEENEPDFMQDFEKQKRFDESELEAMADEQVEESVQQRDIAMFGEPMSLFRLNESETSPVFPFTKYPHTTHDSIGLVELNHISDGHTLITSLTPVSLPEMKQGDVAELDTTLAVDRFGVGIAATIGEEVSSRESHHRERLISSTYSHLSLLSPTSAEYASLLNDLDTIIPAIEGPLSSSFEKLPVRLTHRKVHPLRLSMFYSIIASGAAPTTFIEMEKTTIIQCRFVIAPFSGVEGKTGVESLMDELKPRHTVLFGDRGWGREEIEKDSLTHQILTEALSGFHACTTTPKQSAQIPSDSTQFSLSHIPASSASVTEFGEYRELSRLGMRWKMCGDNVPEDLETLEWLRAEEDEAGNERRNEDEERVVRRVASIADKHRYLVSSTRSFPTHILSSTRLLSQLFPSANTQITRPELLSKLFSSPFSPSSVISPVLLAPPSRSTTVILSDHLVNALPSSFSRDSSSTTHQPVRLARIRGWVNRLGGDPESPRYEMSAESEKRGVTRKRVIPSPIVDEFETPPPPQFDLSETTLGQIISDDQKVREELEKEDDDEVSLRTSAGNVFAWGTGITIIDIQRELRKKGLKVEHIQAGEIKIEGKVFVKKDATGLRIKGEAGKVMSIVRDVVRKGFYYI
ncbi:putative Cleavage and polyadenylation specificity factor subunit 2 [Blattamonas nauphoetae]|uniref:Cleavage and polyadenylation specificity factor subunit 2 n=1 Tax=Blattamonas nauphoetae TaxID=2049346 RepID=A0ABQ9XHD1_9EUKA|nr:putative Cleavage and polyadenylation specificity factor subunit 2 [Blattamonas nauphoetae]